MPHSRVFLKGRIRLSESTPLSSAQLSSSQGSSAQLSSAQFNLAPFITCLPIAGERSLSAAATDKACEVSHTNREDFYFFSVPTSVMTSHSPLPPPASVLGSLNQN